MNDAMVRCESELQHIAAEAVASGDYEAARYGIELAESIAEKRRRAVAGGAQGVNASVPDQADQSGSTVVKKGSRKSVKSLKGAGKSPNYPRFMRQGDMIIKVGWSKKTRKEYQHKAPRSVVAAFATHLRKHTRDGQIFRMEDILPVPDPVHDGELPGYQVYLVLAWLRSLDVIQKQGRDGYTANHAALSEKHQAKLWEAV